MISRRSLLAGLFGTLVGKALPPKPPGPCTVCLGGLHSGPLREVAAAFKRARQCPDPVHEVVVRLEGLISKRKSGPFSRVLGSQRRSQGIRIEVDKAEYVFSRDAMRHISPEDMRCLHPVRGSKKRSGMTYGA